MRSKKVGYAKLVDSKTEEENVTNRALYTIKKEAKNAKT